MPGASKRLDRARVLLQNINDDSTRARVDHITVAIAQHVGDPSVGALAQQAVASAHATGDPAVHAIAVNNLGNLALEKGLHDEAATHHEHALALCQSVGDRKGEVTARGLLAQARWSTGDADGIAQLEAALALAEEANEGSMAGRLLSNLVQAYLNVHRIDDALEAAEAATRLHSELGLAAEKAATLGNLGEVLLETGEIDDARAALESAVEIARRTQWISAEGAFMAGMAEARARSGEDGIELARAAIQILQRIGLRIELAKAWCRLGQIALLDGDQRQAEDALSSAVATASGIDCNPMVRQAIDRLRTALA
jgi:tetratricopeptide (TPR) repeat protein